MYFSNVHIHFIAPVYTIHRGEVGIFIGFLSHKPIAKKRNRFKLLYGLYNLLQTCFRFTPIGVRNFLRILIRPVR